MSDDSNIVYLRRHPRGGDDATLPAGAGPDPELEPELDPLQAQSGPPKVKKVRLALILLGLSLLAGISLVFGMMMAVASDLPDLENRQIYKGARNSVLVDAQGRRIGLITGQQNQVLVPYTQISPAMRNAIIAIEDKRFYENRGIDFQGIGRALYQDILSRSASQGGSTISQQFVKNALQAQQKRTLFQKLREAALAYHLTRKWPKRKILTEYLNSIYFGNGAYGVESAARTYFGTVAGQKVCGAAGLPNCAARLTPAQGALLAGVVASPAAYDPAVRPAAAKGRRDLVLRNMLEQGAISRTVFQEATKESVPPKRDIQPPREESPAPYFTTWVKQQVVNRFGAQRAFAGGLEIKTTLDLDLQQAAQQAVTENLSGVGPNASLVAIDNQTGGVVAMVGGMGDYNENPFNLATQGQRQPGSAFKPFVLARALKEGVSRDSLWTSERKVFRNRRGKTLFSVNNYEDQYRGPITFEEATAESDNSVYAEVGRTVGPRSIARLAREMGIRTRISRNLAMVLGGLKQGVTPLDMAHAYQTFARRGLRIWGSLGAPKRGPLGILSVRGKDGDVIASNQEKEDRVLPVEVSDTATQMLEGVIRDGTGTSAQVDGFAAGKTGTTENYGDAWFVGFNEFYTVAVWVGYSNRLKPMQTEYGGSPVAGGTYPAEIWRQFMESALGVLEERGVTEKLAEEKPDRILPNGTPASAYTPDSGSGTEDGAVDSDGDGVPDDQETATDYGDTTTTEEDVPQEESGDSTGEGTDGGGTGEGSDGGETDAGGTGSEGE